MRIVFIAQDQTRERFRAELAGNGVSILSETSDRDAALKLLPVLAPELVLVEEMGQFASALAWAEQAAAILPGVFLCFMGPALDSQQLLSLMRSGVREYLPDPTVPQLLEAFDRARSSLKPVVAAARPVAASAAGGPQGQIAVVYSPKGGSGKSILASNMALAFYQTTGQRANLVDLSVQFGEQDLLLNLQPQKTVADLLPVMDDLDTRALEQTLTPSPVGVRLLAAPHRIDEAEALSGAHLERAFELLKQQKGWTVVDCASHLDELTCKAIELADVVLVPMTFDLACIRRVGRAFELFKELDLDTSKVKLVAWAERASEIGPADVASTLGRTISYQLPWDREGVSAAINQGIPMLIGQPTAPLSQAFRYVAAELSGAPLPQKAKDANPLGELLNQALGWFKRKKEVPLLTAGSGS